jgi:hypothetical protein
MSLAFAMVDLGCFVATASRKDMQSLDVCVGRIVCRPRDQRRRSLIEEQPDVKWFCKQGDSKRRQKGNGSD